MVLGCVIEASYEATHRQPQTGSSIQSSDGLVSLAEALEQSILEDHHRYVSYQLHQFSTRVLILLTYFSGGTPIPESRTDILSKTTSSGTAPSVVIFSYSVATITCPPFGVKRTAFDLVRHYLRQEISQLLSGYGLQEIE
jgi:hypothetical protein